MASFEKENGTILLGTQFPAFWRTKEPSCSQPSGPFFLDCLTLRMKMLRCVKMLGTASPITQVHISEQVFLQQHCFLNPMSHKSVYLLASSSQCTWTTGTWIISRTIHASCRVKQDYRAFQNISQSKNVNVTKAQDLSLRLVRHIVGIALFNDDVPLRCINEALQHFLAQTHNSL